MADATFKLKWDEDGKRLYETGTDRGVLYPNAPAANSEGHAHDGAVAWNGLTGFTESPEGAEANAIYADNMKYLNMRSAEDYGCNISAYTYPPEFEECNGRKEGADGVYLGQQPRKPFGFCCRTLIGNDVDGDEHGYKLHLVYGCSASPSEQAYQTVNDSPEAIEFSWDIDTIPNVNVPAGMKPCACLTIDSTLADPTKLAALEAILYGSGANDGYLPTPAAVCTMMT